jgi:SAM-dependent methyltransferase
MKKKKTTKKSAKKPIKKVSPKPPRNADRDLREQVVYLLKGGGAHVHFMDALDDFPAGKYGTFANSLPHTGWQLLEHARLAQWDIVDFSRNPKHVSPNFQRDLEEMVRLVRNPRTDLFAKIPHGQGQTILREALLLADHNSYHLGQLVDLRRALGAWQEP